MRPQRLHEEITADYNDMIYAATREEIEARRKTFIRKWRLKHRAVADSLQEAGDGCSASRGCRRASGAAFAPPMPSSGCPRSSNAGSKPRPFCHRPDTAAMLFWALLASGQINMRKVDGW
jgi:putative transposase